VAMNDLKEHETAINVILIVGKCPDMSMDNQLGLQNANAMLLFGLKSTHSALDYISVKITSMLIHVNPSSDGDIGVIYDETCPLVLAEAHDLI
jgi:hypothetical protein